MKRPAALRDAIAGLWSDDAAVRARSGKALTGLAIDMVDIRSAQPALVWAMSDPDPQVRRAAVEATEMRADLGCDVGLAVPALIELAGDPDVEVRRLVWRALRYANPRTRFAERLPDLVARGLADCDADVVAHARTLVAKATPSRPEPVKPAPRPSADTTTTTPDSSAAAKPKATATARPKAPAKASAKARPKTAATARPRADAKAKPKARTTAAARAR